MTIRTRLTFLYSSLLAVVILIFSAATSSILNWTLRKQVDTTLINAIKDMETQVVMSLTSPVAEGEIYMTQFNNLSTPGLFVQVWLQNEQKHSFLLWQTWSLVGAGYNDALDPAGLDKQTSTRRDVMVDNVHLRVATVPFNVNGRVYGHVQAAASLRTVDAAIDRLLRIMLVGGAVALLISLLLGDLMARRALKPIDAIAQTAQQITAADDLGRRIPYEGPPDEIGQLTETFNETLERLERLFKAQRRFVADVSHEMRTPLTTVQGNIDLMRRIGYDTEAMDAMEGEVRRMSRLVGDLLMLAKADGGRLSLEQQVIELDTLVLDVYNQAHMLSQGVDVRLGSIDQVRVIGDQDRIKQLLLNLVSNGLKYTPAGGCVTLSLNRNDRWAYVNVTDTGIGIPEEDLPHIFDRFYRVDKARARALGGTGLGLSIARWIAEAHGGQIHVVSKVGEGSTFTLSLPLLSDEVRKDSMRETRPNMQAIRLQRSSR